MRLATLYTLYGRRAGAELLVEKTLDQFLRQAPEVQLSVFCNTEAERVLKEQFPSIQTRPIPWLDRQIKKAFWLEGLAPHVLHREIFDVFWIPSGANSFPGPWKIPTLVTFLDLGEFFVKNKYDFVRTFYRKHLCIPRSVRRASAFTAISKNTADDLHRLFPSASLARVIYPGASPRPPQAIEDPRAFIKKETGLQVQGRILFSPARTDYRGKGRDILLKTYAEYVRSTHDPRPLIMPGPPGEFHDSMLNDIQTLGLQDKAFWPGRVSDACMDAFYAISDVMIMPSRYEGFGFPLLEAMARNVPVICSDAGSLPEVAGNAALVFPSGDAEALLKNLRLLLSDPALANQLVQNGRQQLTRFSWEHYAGEMLEALRALCAAK